VLKFNNRTPISCRTIASHAFSTGERHTMKTSACAHLLLRLASSHAQRAIRDSFFGSKSMPGGSRERPTCGLVRQRAAITVLRHARRFSRGAGRTIANVPLPYMQGTMSRRRMKWDGCSLLPGRGRHHDPATGFLMNRFGMTRVLLVSSPASPFVRCSAGSRNPCRK